MLTIAFYSIHDSTSVPFNANLVIDDLKEFGDIS
jgi:hypothetical protein